MYTDAFLNVSGSLVGNTLTGQDVHATDTSVLSTNTIDLLQNRDIGEGNEIVARAQVTVAGTTGTSVEVQVVIADNAALTSNLVVLATTGPILTAALVVGARFDMLLPPQIGSLGKRYLGLRYVSVGAMAAICFFADFGLEVQDGTKFYPSGFAIA